MAALFAAVLDTGCKQPPAAPQGEPQTLATVVTIRTTLQPSNRMTRHTLVIGPNVARDTSEGVYWHLYDHRNGQIIAVNDLERSYSTRPAQEWIERRRQIASTMPESPVTFALTSATRSLQGTTARQALVSAGDYRREIWFGEHSQIPATLFPMMLATQSRSGRSAAMTTEVDLGLLSTAGFPLADHSELPIGERTLIVDRVVEKIERRNVPRSLLEVPPQYKQVDPPALPATPPRVEEEEVSVPAPLPEPPPAPPPPVVATATAPAPEKPVAAAEKKPAAGKATVTKATAKKPTAKKPSVKKPASKKPTAKKATSKKPTAKKSPPKKVKKTTPKTSKKKKA